MTKLTDAFLQLFVAKVPQNLTQLAPDCEVMIPVILRLRPFSSLYVTRDVWCVTSSQFLQGQFRGQKTRAGVSNG
jgi:hypothetical protein